MTQPKTNILSRPLTWIAIAFALILVSAWQAELDLFGAWQTEEYSHGFLIPLVALLLGWNRLTEAKPAVRPSWWGIGCLAAAGMLQLAARLSAFEMAAELGLILAIAGLCFAFLGGPAVRVITPALIYLLFAIPLPHLMQANLSQDLQLLSSTLGVWLLDLAGIPVFQEGNIIDLGGYRLQVVDACSGLRYLFPLLSFSYLVAYLLEDRWWKRIAIFLSAIPLTIGLNSLRIAIVGITVDLWGGKMAEGFIHAFEGWAVFLVCIAALMGETWLLLRIGKRGRFRYEYLGFAPGKPFGGKIPLKNPGIAALTLAALFALVFGTGLVDRRVEITPPHPPLASFPPALGAWQGQAEAIESNILNELQLSDYWLADYSNPDAAASVNLYIAYYASQHVGSTTHSPSNCIPGGGWQIETSRVETVPLADGTPLRHTRLVIRRGADAELVYYWFDERGRDITETTSAKWYLLWDSIIMHRTDGALVRLITPLAQNETETSAERRLRDFASLVYPRIKVFVPGGPAMNNVAAP